MSPRGILSEIDPGLGGEDQVGLFVQCSDEQAAVLYRLLRERYGTRLPRSIMPSRRTAFTHFCYVPDTKEGWEAAWPAIERRVLEATGTAVQPPPTSVSASAPAAAHALPDQAAMTAWKARMRRHAAALLPARGEQRAAEVSPMASPYWATELAGDIARGGDLAAAEARLAAIARAGDPNGLRAWISLYAETGRDDRIVALTEEMRDAVLGLPVGRVLAIQVTRAHVRAYRQAIAGDDGTRARDLGETLRALRRLYVPELERLQQAATLHSLFADVVEEGRVPSGPSIDETLSDILSLEPGERIPALEALYAPTIPATARAGELLADALSATGNHARAADIYGELEQHMGDGARRDALRLKQIQEYIASGDVSRARSCVDPADPTPSLRGQLGVALAALGDDDSAREHLVYAWNAGDHNAGLARALATLCRSHEWYHIAAEPYQELLVSAPETLDAVDDLMLAQLAFLGELGDIAVERQIAFIDHFCDTAPFGLLQTAAAREVVASGLDLCRRINDPNILLVAYRHMLDVLLGWGEAGTIAACMADMSHDYAAQRLAGSDYFALLDEITDYQDLYPSLRDALIDGYMALLDREYEYSLRKGIPLRPYASDIRRALLVLDPEVYEALHGEYQRRKALLEEQGISIAADDQHEESMPSFDGLTIALIGGHAATRRGVRAALEEGGGRVVEVPPSSEAHFTEGSVLERIRSADLVAMIVRYMGHDLSEAVDHLSERGTIHGDIIRVLPRGRSGVLEAIRTWARGRIA